MIIKYCPNTLPPAPMISKQTTMHLWLKFLKRLCNLKQLRNRTLYTAPELGALPELTKGSLQID
jgi:hypothetical protein